MAKANRKLVNPASKYSVLVAGGGISGLTAAHELSERGFKVLLVEKQVGLTAAGDEDNPEMLLGGMAKTQYALGTEENELPWARDLDLDTPPVLPGEHGFRFFPSYYSHVWNTMQRIPIYQKVKGKQRPVDRTVFDNLEPCRTVASGAEDTVPYVLDRSRPRSAAEWVDRMVILFEAGYKPMDLDIYVVRLLRYMCTCSDRRQATCEDISFFDYLVGREMGSRYDKYHYSEEFLDSIRTMPKVLAAFDACYGDARTNWSTMVQLIANEVQEMPKVDAVLNGPTTEVWIKPWRKHLKRLGVKFVSAEVDHFHLVDGKPQPVFTDHPKTPKGNPVSDAVLEQLTSVDYIVVAMDAPGAAETTSELPQCGVVADLPRFVYDIPAENPLEHHERRHPRSMRRDPYTESGKKRWDRFQTLTGAQYFFDRYIRMVHGHIYMPGTEWALSSLFEQDFWIERPNLEKDGYLTLFSLDIGDWRRASNYTHKRAADSTREELAVEAWRQSKMAMGKINELELPDPAWYHIDTNIEYDPETQLPWRNKTPYLVPIVGEFDERPGGDPWDPAGPCGILMPWNEHHPGRHHQHDRNPETQHLWQAGHGGYIVHFNSMVFAGTYKKTFTRMTTMESACESGRHAVNAIIDHCLHCENGDPRDQPGQSWRVPIGFRTERHLDPVYEPTHMADYCQIYDMEANEIPDLELAKTIDQWFFDHNLPHPWEVLGIDAFVSYISYVGAKFPLPKLDAASSEALVDLLAKSISPRLVKGLDREFMSGELSMENYMTTVLDSMRHLRGWMERMLPSASNDRRPTDRRPGRRASRRHRHRDE